MHHPHGTPEVCHDTAGQADRVEQPVEGMGGELIARADPTSQRLTEQLHQDHQKGKGPERPGTAAEGQPAVMDGVTEVQAGRPQA